MERESIFAEVEEERRNQDWQWGGPDHDDEHHPMEWFRFIEQQKMKIEDEALSSIEKEFEDESLNNAGARAEMCRSRLVKVAALAVAGIESIDRKNERRKKNGRN